MDIPDTLPHPLIPLHAPSVAFENVGGKGANLVALAQGGFAVPDAFLIPTSVYRDYVSNNQLDARISAVLETTDPTHPDELEYASNQIRAAFNEGSFSGNLTQKLTAAWHWLGGEPVAVRSSATAEDLPEMSFAGQQDTYLNVIGGQALTQAVVSCWASLWTARAIGYRARNHIPQRDVSLSVVVQRMVQSQASGVLFTANPLTGLRSETTIDATLGLGEALVSGQVEPDHYLVDAKNGKILQKTVGAKALIIRGEAGGGVLMEKTEASDTQAIPDEVILELVETGQQVEALFGSPQDIEWAWADEKLFILQSRPITSLYPIPQGPDDGHLKVFFSFGAVQGILTPMTPLGQDAIRLIFAGGATLFETYPTYKTQGVIYPAGERLWGNFTAILRHPVGARLAPKVFPGIEPGSLEALKTILATSQIEAGSGKIRLRTFRRLTKFARRMLRKARHFAKAPEDKAAEIKQKYEAELATLRAKYDDSSSLKEAVALFHEIKNAFPYAVPEIAAGALVGLLPLLPLTKLSHHLTGNNELALKITRGLPNNVTTEMDLKLWAAAQAIRSDAEAFQAMTSLPAESLCERYQQEGLPPDAQQALDTFLEEYGSRGLGEIDIGRPRWRENPTQIIQTLQSYLRITDEDSAPDIVFRRGEVEAQAALQTLQTAARKTFAGRIKARLIGWLARRLRALGGLRESPKFYIIQMMGIMRQKLLDQGAQFVRQGKLSQPDDLFYLFLDELESLAAGEDRDWKALVAKHRANYAREMQRRQVPRLIMSNGRTFYEGIQADDPGSDRLAGSPVSPGVVEGIAHVVLDPHAANLAPGEILVCPGTDPAWTPLFLAAGGLIMETGGMMTHGAIVAREYGIPAVVGVHQATERIQTGERLRVNGSTGLVEKIPG